MSEPIQRRIGRGKDWIPDELPNGENYLLVIGIDDYSNGIPKLNNAVKDAQTVTQLLQQKYQFDEQHTKTLYNQEATKDAILAIFDFYLKTLTDQDNLIFYFSGHGEYLQLNKKGYWIPVDAMEGKRGSFLSNTEVLDLINLLKARHVFGIVDSCFSAALFAPSRSMDDQSRRLFATPSRWLLTAGRLEPVSDGSLGDHSPFAKTLISQLTYNTDPYLWTSELCVKVLKGVAFNTDQQMPRGEPLQNAGHQGGDFIFMKQEGLVEEILPIIKPAPVTNDTTQVINRGMEEVAPEPKPVVDASGLGLEALKKHLEELVSEGDYESVFSDLKKVVQSNSSHYQSIILLQARYNSMGKDLATGMSTAKEAKSEQMQINNGLLFVIGKLKDRDLS